MQRHLAVFFFIYYSVQISLKDRSVVWTRVLLLFLSALSTLQIFWPVSCRIFNIEGHPWHKTAIVVEKLQCFSSLYTGGILGSLALMCTALWQRKRVQHRGSKNEHSVVTAVAVTVLRQCDKDDNCQWTPLSRCCQCYRYHSAISCHCCYASVHSNVTVLSLSSLLHRWHFSSTIH